MRNNFCLFIAMSLALFSNAQEPDSSFHLYLLIGQSNMAGRGTLSEKNQHPPSDRILMLNKANEWVPATHPLHFDKPAVAGVGPGLSFAEVIATSNPGIKIGLVPCAVGGSSIKAWQPGGFDKATGTHPYDDALARIKAAMKSGVFKGILWHQGEADSKPESAARYLADLKELVNRLRAESGNPSLPFVAGELGRYKPVYQNINEQLKNLSRVISYSAVAGSENLEHKGDSTHFDSRSAEELGKRYAEKMLALQQQAR
jgi:hypothetical protein